MQLANSTTHGQHMARLNRLIQTTLMTGLTLSMLFMAAGALLYSMHGPVGGATSIALHSVLPGIIAGNPLAFMVAGVMLLMITPALRVVVAAIGYMLEHDWLFAVISGGVVLVLLVSMLIGSA